MPESRVPAVYVEEMKRPTRTITGADTGTAAMIGPTTHGPTGIVSETLTSFSDFVAVCGLPADPRDVLTGAVAQAARAFFNEGGKRLLVARTAGSAGQPTTVTDYEAALVALEVEDQILTIAAPGSSADATLREPVWRALVRHAERPRAGRFALLDPAPGTAPADVAGVRAVIDSPFGALHYPWIVARDPATGAEVMTPPLGAVAGIYARVDASRGVHKAPANESVRSAVRFERELTPRDNELLNPAGVNALRSFVGRGNLVWGARTLASDPQWKYVNVRRHLTYIEHSIARGLAWAVFEPNDEPLWIAVRHHVELFLQQEWQNGALMGDRPDAAYFVRCDRTTMTPDDILNRRLECQVGVAPLKPAEFVVFRIDLSTS